MKVLGKLSVSALAVLSLAACSNHVELKELSGSTDVSLTPGQVAGQQLALAVAWVQNAAEYRALAYQAFNFATLAFTQAENINGKMKAVIVDLDETMLDNSEYQGGVIKAGVPFNAQTWGRWEQQGTPKAVPGAVEFAQYVTAHQGKVFYVSNRQASNLSYTQQTLKALGFPDVSDQTVLLQAGKDSSKDPRFAQVAKNYNVVLYVGDNLKDYPNVSKLETTAARNAWVEQNSQQFGVKYIIIPNPMYGNWVNALAPGFYSRTLTEQNKLKVEALKPWDLINYQED
ncbi:5'-nucleotidase, lipoprotein e(P4) family [Psittacicella hinzii]|uniref:5'-nucleotidase, lipoprotein e(P4) family n=1 Tax=Psittacicella hinzii TaxID=2028575 RepID=A0A3A1YQ66_9GAMM|nr:5'-nucleotidase, lipoprotein e(P4) family [Psittacicella hinzii]RIY39090.1 5'-nucleotidase, lipoprotein e(P4) family [Psittacicella hinzii]